MSKLTLAVGPEMDRGGRKVRPVVVLEQDEALRAKGGAIFLNEGSPQIVSVYHPEWASATRRLYVRGLCRDRDEWAAFVPVEDWPAVEKAVMEFGGMVMAGCPNHDHDRNIGCLSPACGPLRRGIALSDGNGEPERSEVNACSCAKWGDVVRHVPPCRGPKAEATSISVGTCSSAACAAKGRHVPPCEGASTKPDAPITFDGAGDARPETVFQCCENITCREKNGPRLAKYRYVWTGDENSSHGKSPYYTCETCAFFTGATGSWKEEQMSTPVSPVSLEPKTESTQGHPRTGPNPKPSAPPRCRFAAAVYTGQERKFPEDPSESVYAEPGVLDTVAANCWKTAVELGLQVKVPFLEWPRCRVTGKLVSLAYLHMEGKLRAYFLCADCSAK